MVSYSARFLECGADRRSRKARSPSIVAAGILSFKIIHAEDAAYDAIIDRAIIDRARTTMRSVIGSMEIDKPF
jgi:hypothetical protein